MCIVQMNSSHVCERGVQLYLRSTKGVWVLCLRQARAFFPQTIGSEIRTTGSKERRTNTVGPRSRCMRGDECSGDHISVATFNETSPWHATPVGQWHDKRFPLSSFNFKSSSLLLERYFRSWPFTTEGVPPSNRPNVLAHVASHTHTDVRQRDPLRQVFQPHRRWASGVA